MILLISSTADTVVQFVVVTLIFIFVLAITYFTTRFVGSYQKKTMSHGNIKIIESTRISNSKVLEVVKVGDKCFLIAVCKDTVTTIGEINEDTLELDSASDNASFGTVFNRFKMMHREEEQDNKQDENGAEDEE